MSRNAASRLLSAVRSGEGVEHALGDLTDSLRGYGELLVATLDAERGEQPAALNRARAVVAAGGAELTLEAAPLLFAMGAYSEALRSLDVASSAPALAPLAARLRLELVRPAGLDRDAVSAAAAMRLQRPHDPDLIAQAAALYGRARHHERSLEFVQEQLATECTAPLLLAKAELLLEIGRPDDATACAEAALALDLPLEDDAISPMVSEVIALLVEAGAIDRAEELLRKQPQTADALAARARLRLFRRDLVTVRELAGRAIRQQPEHPSAQRCLGAVELLEGRFESALRFLDRAIAGASDDPEALAFRGEVRLRLGDQPGARADLHAALGLCRGFNPSIRMLRLVSELREDLDNEVVGRQRRPDEPSTDAHGRATEVAEVLVELFPERPSVVAEAEEDLRELVGRLEEGLSKMAGNRSSAPSWLRDGELLAIRTRTSPRDLSRWALELIRVAEPSEVLAVFDEVMARYPSSSMPVVHRGELHLWLGDTAAARRDFERSRQIDPGTRWAYIGLSGVCILEGDPEGALAINAEGVRIKRSTIGSIFVYRGEAYRRLGRLEEARSDLEEACRIHPTRVGAWMNLALCADAQGDHEVGAHWFERLRTHSPVLLSDAADDGAAALAALLVAETPGPDVRRPVLERCLELMRGNRSSSCQTYFTADGKLRVVSKPDLSDEIGRGQRRRAAMLAGLRRRYARRLS